MPGLRLSDAVLVLNALAQVEMIGHRRSLNANSALSLQQARLTPDHESDEANHAFAEFQA